MRRLALWLLPIALSAGQARYARVGDYDGDVQVQLQAADDWQAAQRNLPLRELSWLRTAGPARVEVELDDGNVLRLGPDSLAELSDYTRLSTGQRITLISLDHGLAYFTGAAEGKDALVVAVPGAQVTIHQGARLRLEARDPWSQIAVSDGVARFSSPTAEFDLTAGQMVKLDPAHPARFFLNREIPPLETDRWCDERDKVLQSTTSAAHVPALSYGLADLDAYGVWIQTGDFGAVWKPKAPAGWAPFRNGRWLWYDGLGYTWIGDDAWGWLPYHYGRWTLLEGTGWVWIPGESTVFKPGDVYWLKSAKLVGWGALAPGEDWKPPAAPRLFLNANTTYAVYTPESREIDPNFATRPKEPLATAVFALALPSPPFPAARLDAVRPPLHAGSARAVSVSTEMAYDPAPSPAPSDAAYVPPALPPVVIVNPTQEVDVEVDVPVPVYTGIIMVTPPGYQAPAAKKPSKPVSPPPPAKPKVPDPDKPVR
ncbi:MAG: DUF6600 domain-containing protein [Bryobacteraceae bacterium]|jgi:hypothetical protein